jgi:hypothetical protein
VPTCCSLPHAPRTSLSPSLSRCLSLSLSRCDARARRSRAGRRRGSPPMRRTGDAVTPFSALARRRPPCSSSTFAVAGAWRCPGDGRSATPALQCVGAPAATILALHVSLSLPHPGAHLLSLPLSTYGICFGGF